MPIRPGYQLGRPTKWEVTLKRILFFALMMASLGLIAASPVAAAPAPAPTYVVNWEGSQANKAPYWEDRLKRGYGLDVECRKVDQSGRFTTSVQHDAIIIKAGQKNYIWIPAPAATYTSPQGVSHYFICDGDEAQLNPKARVIGPCGDPFYRVVFNNTESSVALEFTWRIRSRGGVVLVTIEVPAGAIWRSGWRWVDASTQMWVNVALPDGSTSRLLTMTSAPGGWYGQCPDNFQRGFSYPNN
jgi:hypothetical protein